MKKLIRAFILTAALCGAPALAQDAAKPDWMQYKSPYVGEENDIANAHRTSDEIMAWGSKIAADALSYDLSNFTSHADTLKTSFVQSGWGDYVTYLKDMKLLDVARSGKYMIATASNGDPMILNSGNMNGAWHWEISVPIITSINQPDKEGSPQTVSTSKTRIKILLTRVAEGGTDGIAVESWKLDAEHK